MSDLQLILYDDEKARDWFPFTATRPAGELLFGAHTIRERAETVTGLRCVGYIADAALADFDEPGAPPVLQLGDIPADKPLLFLNSRAILRKKPELSRSGLIVVDEQIVGFVALQSKDRPTELQLMSAAEGQLLGEVWHLMSRNAEQLGIDIAARAAGNWSAVPDSVSPIGKPSLLLGSNVTIEPHVIFDFSDGPIWLDDDVTVRGFTRLAGPAYVGRGSTLFGGSYTAITIGPGSKIRGEVESTVVLGYSNKAHDGFLGHAYLGKWVNLGALTTNSDLKNNYGAIRLWTPRGEVNTGEMKIGCLLGDHVKTAIGMMLNTGTVVGPGSNIFGGPPDKFVAPFSWGGAGEYAYDKFIETAEVVMARRKQQLTGKQRNLLKTAWQRGRALAES